MNVKRWLATIVVVGLVIAVATPVWAQTKSAARGKPPKPPKTTCDVSEYDATVQFLSHPEDGQLPAIYAAGDPDPDPDPDPENPQPPPIRGDATSTLLNTTFVNGHVRSYLQHPNAVPLPLELDFSLGSHNGDPVDHSPGSPDPNVLAVDPRLTIFAYDKDTLDFPECEMLGMTVGDADSYDGRTGFLWYESDQGPVGQGAEGGDQWVLRHKPSDIFGNVPTHTTIVRVHPNIWVLTSRDDSKIFDDDGTEVDAPHFASLQDYGSGSGHGKNAVPDTFYTPIMPVQIVLRVDCEPVAATSEIPWACAAGTTLLPVPGG